MTSLLRCLSLGALILFVGSRTLAAQEYYAVAQIDQAKAEARAKHLPIAWLSSPMVYLNSNYANDAPGSPAELTALALRTLRGQAVIIFQDADNDLPNMPQNMIDRIETKDEGNNLPNGWHYTAPKIIYTDPGLKTFFGCTLAPDLRSDREAAINVALHRIRDDRQDQALINGTAPADTVDAAPGQAAAPAPVPQPATGALATLVAMGTSGSLFICVAGALVVVLVIVGIMASRSRP
jgi:hypothetical protein